MLLALYFIRLMLQDFMTQIQPLCNVLDSIQARWKTRGRGPGVRGAGSRGVENAGRGKRGAWKTRGVENAGCGKRGVWKTRGLVENTGSK